MKHNTVTYDRHAILFRTLFNKLLVYYGHTRESLADKTGYKLSYISLITSKNKPVSNKFIMVISRALKLSTPHTRMIRVRAINKNKEILKRIQKR